MEFIAKYGSFLDKIICDDPLSVTELTVPDGFDSILKGAFEPFKNVKRIVLPESVTDFDDECFMDCDKLEEIVMPGVENIYEGYFAGCKLIKKLVLPKALKIIGTSAFLDLKGLESVVFEGLDNFNYYEYIGFNGLTDEMITLPGESAKPVYEYTADMGEYSIDAKVAEELRGKAPVVQARHFGLATHYNQKFIEPKLDFSGFLCDRTEMFIKTFRKVGGFIMHDGLLVGYMLKSDAKPIPVLVGQDAMYAQKEETVGGDNNVAGYKGGETFTVKEYVRMLYY